MKKNKQNGFSTLVLVVCAVVVVVVAGLVVWRVLDASKTSDTQTVENAADQQPQADPNEGYVVIKEWGVRFKAAEGLGTVIQAAQPTTAVPVDGGDSSPLPEGSVKISLSTQKLADLSKDCDVSQGSTGVWELYRSPHPLTIPETASLGEIEGHYYYYFGAQSACVTSQTEDDLNVQVSRQLRDSIKTLEAAQ